MQTPATPLGTHHGARHEHTILLIGHGSREPSGNQEIEDFAQAWRAQRPHAPLDPPCQRPPPCQPFHLMS